MRIVRTLVIVALSAGLTLPASALASSDEVIDDCSQDGRVDGRYSEEELRDAEDDLPSDVDEYTDCREAIRSEIGRKEARERAARRREREAREREAREAREAREREREEAAGAGGSGGSSGSATPGGSGDSGPAAGDDLAALGVLERSARGGDAPALDVGDGKVTPGESGDGELFGIAKAANDLPPSILSALALMLLLAAAATFLAMRHRLPARAGRARRAKGAPTSRRVRRDWRPGFLRR